jgi:hypothetical protein
VICLVSCFNSLNFIIKRIFATIKYTNSQSNSFNLIKYAPIYIHEILILMNYNQITAYNNIMGRGEPLRSFRSDSRSRMLLFVFKDKTTPSKRLYYIKYLLNYHTFEIRRIFHLSIVQLKISVLPMHRALICGTFASRTESKDFLL